MAAQLSEMNGPLARRLSACRKRATISLPVPLSPVIRTLASAGANCRARSSTPVMAAETQTSCLEGVLAACSMAAISSGVRRQGEEIPGTSSDRGNGRCGLGIDAVGDDRQMEALDLERLDQGRHVGGEVDEDEIGATTRAQARERGRGIGDPPDGSTSGRRHVDRARHFPPSRGR